MPELPEVETVRRVLAKKIIGTKIVDVKVYYDKTITIDKKKFIENLKNQKINDLKRRGKWLIFQLDDYYLISHLRMEGKYVFRKPNQALEKHQHVCFLLDNDIDLRYEDSRKFGRMQLIKKDAFNLVFFFQNLGPEPEQLELEYLKNTYQKRKIHIKTALLDQSIFVGVGNIYADEILFLSKINPKKKTNELTDSEIKKIITNTKKVLKKAINLGGTTISTYMPEEGKKGMFQQELLVHNRANELCFTCQNKIIKAKVNNRGTYYCPKCQK